MSKTELKPCPFCGGEAEYGKRKSEFPYIHAVMCNNCHCRTSFEKSENEAVEKWNTRKPMEQIADNMLGEIMERDCEYKDGWNDAIDRAIDIVEAGGEDE